MVIVAIEHAIEFADQRPLCTRVVGFAERVSLSSSLVFANRLSRPVGRSGGKNRCGRSQAPSSSSTARLALMGDGLVGVQSIASSSGLSSTLIGDPWEAAGAEDIKEGWPNTGLVEMSGLEESVREAKRSGSLFADAAGMGEARALCVDDSGVSRTEAVSMRRITGGRCKCKMVNDDENTYFVSIDGPITSKKNNIPIIQQ